MRPPPLKKETMRRIARAFARAVTCGGCATDDPPARRQNEGEEGPAVHLRLTQATRKALRLHLTTVMRLAPARSHAATVSPQRSNPEMSLDGPFRVKHVRRQKSQRGTLSSSFRKN